MSDWVSRQLGSEGLYGTFVNFFEVYLDTSKSDPLALSRFRCPLAGHVHGSTALWNHRGIFFSISIVEVSNGSEFDDSLSFFAGTVGVLPLMLNEHLSVSAAREWFKVARALLEPDWLAMVD